MKKETPCIIKKIFAINFINRFSRKKLIDRQSVAAHTSMVVILVSLISLLENNRRKSKGLALINREKAMDKAAWHDVGEIYVDDIPAPIRNKIKEAVEKLEKEEVEDDLLKKIDKGVRDQIRDNVLNCKEELEGKLVDVYDKIERLIYIYYEKQAGNKSLMDAFNKTIERIDEKGYEDIQALFWVLSNQEL